MNCPSFPSHRVVIVGFVGLVFVGYGLFPLIVHMTYNQNIHIQLLTPQPQAVVTHTTTRSMVTVRENWNCLDDKSSTFVAVSPTDFCNGGRLGNKMFMVAAAISIACRNRASFVLIADKGRCKWAHNLRELFSGLDNVTVIMDTETKDWRKIHQKPYMSYKPYTVTSSTLLSGFYQNHRYLSDAEQTIRQAFKLTRKYIEHSNGKYKDIEKRHSMVAAPVYVGVHVRLGDMLLKPQIKRYGYTMATEVFYEQAMERFANEYGRDRVIFVVASDSIHIAEGILRNITTGYRIEYLRGHSAHEDFSVLSNAHHMITSGGTFGFWAAWLVPGDVVYFSEYARKGSQLDKVGYCRTCFNLPYWIPFGNSFNS